MAGAAAAILRSVVRRSGTPVLVGVPRSQPQPQASSAVLSTRSLFHGGLVRRQDLHHMATSDASTVLYPRDGELPHVTSARLLSSVSPRSPDKNPSPPCTQAATSGMETCRTNAENKNKEQAKSPHDKLLQLQRQIQYKQGELLQLLLEMQGERKPTPSDTDKCLVEKEELLHLLREFQAKIREQSNEEPVYDAFGNFLLKTAYVMIVVAIVVVVMT